MRNTDRSETIDSAEEFLTRRKMMATSAALATSGLAGCGSSGGNGNGNGGNGNGNGGNGNGGNGNGSSSGDQTITTFLTSIPGEMNFNTWAPSYPWTGSWLWLEPVLRFYADGSISLELIDDWEYDEDAQTTTVHHNDDYYWWNGDTVTAEDKYWYEETARLFAPESSDFEQITLENNGQTIVREYKQPQNPQLVEYGLGGYLGAMVRGHRDKFRPWAEELADATTSEERTSIQERMAEEMPLNIETVIDEGLGMGPFKMVDYDEQGVYGELYDKHPNADNINIDKLDYKLVANDAIAQRISGGDLDIGYGLLSTWLGGSEPGHTETVTTYRDTFMRKLEFMGQGPGSEHLRKVEVRRAIAHALNLEFVSTNYDAESSPRTRQTGLPEKVTDNWLGDYVDDFLEYPVEGDEQGAVDLMEQAGYERDGGNWVDEDGDQLALEIVVPSWLSNLTRTVSDQLSNFGFEVNSTMLEGASYNDRTEDNIDFDITIGSHGSLTAHPAYFFRATHPSGNDLGEQSVIENAIADGEARSPYNGKEFVVEIPTEVGQEDLSGSTEEVNVYELHQEWLTAQSDERNQEIAQKFSWYWNYYLPGIDMVEQVDGSWGKTADWEFDINEEWQAYRGAFLGLKRGYISPK